MKEISEKIEEKFVEELLDKVVKRAVEVIENRKPWNQGDIGPATLRREEAAQYLGISITFLNKLINEREIPCIRPHGPGRGRMILFRRVALDGWMKAKEEESLKSEEDLAEEMNDGYKFKVN